MSNAEEFLNVYKELESLVKHKYGLSNYDSAITELIKQPEFMKLKDDLRFIREIRNFIQHEPNRCGGYPIEPNRGLIEIVKNVKQRIENPPKAYDYCIKIDNVYSCRKDECIFPIMQEMKQKTYTHVPILEDGKVIGAFSENTLFGALIEDELVYEKQNTKFSEKLIFDNCKLSNHVSECFEFIPKNASLEFAKKKFNDAFKHRKRLSMIFITETGKETEALLGIITPWDIIYK